ncbi:MAG: hypothetical protein IKI67_00165 [Bacteroidales bacterium]|nr:hypothetical protein [Bacteroidales bacterium]
MFIIKTILKKQSLKNSVLFCIVFTITCFFSFSCKKKYSDPYSELEHRGQKNIQITEIQFDSLYLDASMTSFGGLWLMPERGNKIYFADLHSVGVSRYDLDGNYETTLIEQGRGPNEMIAPIWAATFDREGNFTAIDLNAALHIYDSSLTQKIYYEPNAWFANLDENFGGKEWEKLSKNPDPEIPQMYEYNWWVDNIEYSDDLLYIPIITEHKDYNYYNATTRAKECWSNAYTFISLNPKNMSNTKKLLGHYPSVYQRSNIPIFGYYSFAFNSNRLLVSFNADPNIYVLDYNGRPLYCFGFEDSGISRDYPPTKNFTEFRENASEYRKKYGFYNQIFAHREYLLRTCCLDGEGKYKLQIYKNEEMIGDVFLDFPMRIIGCAKGGGYYAFVRKDIENEQFVLVRFKLNIN